MAEQKTTAGRWLETAVKGIRFKPDRAEVERELRGHIEDKMADFQRLYPDLPQEEAEAMALGRMGDPEEIGRELARVHRPWLGYLWQASRWAAALAAVLAIVVWTPRWGELAWEWMQNWDQPPSYSENIERCYQEGIDPFGADGPYPGEQTNIVRTPLMVSQPQETVWTEGYVLRVDQAALWSFRGVAERRTLFCSLKAWGWPWQPLSLEAVYRVRGVDSVGKQFYSANQVHDQYMDYEAAGGGYITVNQSGGGILGQQFAVDVSGISPEAQWLRLEYDYGGVYWTLTITIDAQEVRNGQTE